MLYHISINAHDTDRVANAMAEIFEGTVVHAPAPPFHPESRFVCCWDERGTMMEVGPMGWTMRPGQIEEAAMVMEDGMNEVSGFHGLFLAKVSEERILEIAAREGWRAARVDNGPFFVINVWLENRQLLEFTTPELYPAYQRVFGTENRDQLDGQLRGLEAYLKSLSVEHPAVV